MSYEQAQGPSIESTSIFTDFAHVISGARKSATQEFKSFWEMIGSRVQPETDTVAAALESAGIIYGRIIPDHNRQSLVKDACIQTELTGNKRRYEDDGSSSRVQKLAKTTPPRISNTSKVKQASPKLAFFTPKTPSLTLIKEQPIPKSKALSASTMTSSHASTNSMAGYVKMKVNEYEANTLTPQIIPTPSLSQTCDPITQLPFILYQSSNYALPTDDHKAKMKELIRYIPYFKLRKADIITDADGTRRPNPYWNEIHNPRTILYYYQNKK